MCWRRWFRGIWPIVICLLALAGVVALFLIPPVVWLVLLGVLGGIGLMCLIKQ
jgi:hypothetical protein